MSQFTEYVAVVDRFEGDEAVLLLERNGETVGDLVVSCEDLPSDARTQDAVLFVEIDDDAHLVDARFDPEATERRAERTQSRFDRLAQRPSDGDTVETDATDRDTRDGHDTSGDADENDVRDESGNTE